MNDRRTNNIIHQYDNKNISLGPLILVQYQLF